MNVDYYLLLSLMEVSTDTQRLFYHKKEGPSDYFFMKFLLIYHHPISMYKLHNWKQIEQPLTLPAKITPSQPRRFSARPWPPT